MVSLYAQERQQKILELINAKNKVSVNELCDLFGASPGTIRNDLSTLEKMDLIDRTHGGAISVSKIGFERRTQDKVIKHKNEKIAIGRLAAGIIEDGDVIAVDTSTTTLEMVKFLRDRHDLTIVTNDLTIASLIEDFDDVAVMFIGGIIRKGYNCALGPQAVAALSEIRVDKTFLSCNGISVEYGITTPNVDMAHYKRKIIEIANETILLSDSSKINRTCFIKIASINAIDYWITDDGINDKDLEEFKLAGLDIKIARSIS